MTVFINNVQKTFMQVQLPRDLPCLLPTKLRQSSNVGGLLHAQYFNSFQRHQNGDHLGTNIKEKFFQLLESNLLLNLMGLMGHKAQLLLLMDCCCLKSVMERWEERISWSRRPPGSSRTSTRHGISVRLVRVHCVHTFRSRTSTRHAL